jgi:hypothetical protein
MVRSPRQLGAGIIMGFADALSDEREPHRARPCLGARIRGIGHTLPVLIPDFRAAVTAAIAVVLAELGIIAWIRHRYMESSALSATLQVGLGEIGSS